MSRGTEEALRCRSPSPHGGDEGNQGGEETHEHANGIFPPPPSLSLVVLLPQRRRLKETFFPFPVSFSPYNMLHLAPLTTLR